MIISWGIPTIEVTKLAADGTPTQQVVNFPTPADGTTQLSSEKGDKMEALIEGGEPEAVKYKRGKYTLEFQIRIGQGRLPSANNMIDGIDGVVPGEWKVKLTPEDATQGAPGFTMPKSVCSYTDTYSAADGIIRTYTFDSLKPATGAQIVWDANTPVVYTAVTNPTGSPKTKGYYELVNGQYVLSEDTTVDSTKTYYQQSNA